ncbi:hypothetical protein SSX86_007371 [Deinandra increscens subsp. villosa]|uniref:DUF674 family protein n=1 Tax=Deinandra increscens subsp. villosa TaxID=3103831 RepID=A0AAP0H4W0_9ASTR
MGSKPVHLKVFVDKKKKKVMFAEAEQDFVEILFSFLTLPLGTVARISTKNKAATETDTKVGSLSSLYESIENLDNKHFSNEHCKIALMNPNSSSLALCQKLKINLNSTKPVEASDSTHGDVVFFKKKTSFIITDDLNVIPVLLDTSITLLNFLGVEFIDLLEERTMDFGLEEFSSLLKWSLVTNTPLTNMVLGGSKPCSCSSCIKTSTTSNLPLVTSYPTQRQKVKLLIQKSKGKVLCAQTDNFFVEMLFSFLTIPLGNAKRLTTDNSSPTGIDNMYNSISSLGDGKYLKSEEIKNMLLCPKLASNYLRVTDLLPIYDKSTNQGCFLKEQGTFIVSDELEVTVSPSLSTISKFNTLGIPVGDIEVMEVSIGEQEAILILKASLTSTTALTDCLSSFKNAKSLI